LRSTVSINGASDGVAARADKIAITANATNIQARFPLTSLKIIPF
jgi:hypothetical protein